MTDPTTDPRDRDVSVDRFATDAGAYVLGALSPEERSAFEAHLPTCAACRGDVADVAGLPALLDAVPRDLVEALAPDGVSPSEPSSGPRTSDAPLSPGGWWGTGRVDAPPGLLADLLRVVRREERSSMRRRALAGALATAAVVAGTLAMTGAPMPWSSPAPAPVVAAEAIELVALGEAPVSASVRLDAVAWGTRIELSCRYDAGGGANPYAEGAPLPSYSLVVGDASGRTEEVATWSAVPGKDLTVPASTVMPRDEIVLVEMRAADGTTVLRART